jgi:hypothetical protein
LAGDLDTFLGVFSFWGVVFLGVDSFSFGVDALSFFSLIGVLDLEAFF